MTTPGVRPGQTWEAIEPPGCNYRALINVTAEPDSDGWVAGVYQWQYRTAHGTWVDCIGPGAPRRTRIKAESLGRRYQLLEES